MGGRVTDAAPPGPAGQPAPLPAVLAIDGGNSKTDVALIAADGTLLARERGPGSNWQSLGEEEAMATLAGLVRAAARAAGLAGTNSPIARHTAACLAGADLPEEEEHLAGLVQAQGWAAASTVVNDTFAVLRAGVPGSRGPDGCLRPAAHPGIAVTCGAGINCVGVGPDGRTARFLSFGEISGDWGGGGDLGRAALWWAARAEDGRGPQTRLRADVPWHFGLGTVREVTLGLYHGTIAGPALRGLVPALLAAAAAGDEVARGLVQRLADEVVTMAVTAMRRLGLAGEPLPVVLGGSILAAADPLLTGFITAGLAEQAPGAQVQLVEVPPVAGAALLGLDRVGAPAGAEDRLRAGFRPGRPG